MIVALTVGGQEHSTLPAHHVLDNLRKSGASLHVLTVVNNTLRSQPTATTAAGLLGENMNLGEVLGDGPKQSGGRRDEIVAVAGVMTGLQQLAEALKRQYVIEYTLPDGVKPSGKLSVSLKRKGVTLHAPTRIPDKYSTDCGPLKRLTGPETGTEQNQRRRGLLRHARSMRFSKHRFTRFGMITCTPSTALVFVPSPTLLPRVYEVRRQSTSNGRATVRLPAAS